VSYIADSQYYIYNSVRPKYVIIDSIGPKVYKKENILGCFEYRNHIFIKGDCKKN